jgi:hypothetical protein
MLIFCDVTLRAIMLSEVDSCMACCMNVYFFLKYRIVNIFQTLKINQIIKYFFIKNYKLFESKLDLKQKQNLYLKQDYHIYHDLLCSKIMMKTGVVFTWKELWSNTFLGNFFF